MMDFNQPGIILDEQGNLKLADMNKATRAAASILGVYAGLLGMQHGYFEIQQGSTPTGGLMINAIGSPCQPEAVWHACLPALTLIPNYFITGILAVFSGLAVLIWAAGFVQRKHGGWVLLILSILMLLLGGGFVPAFIGAIASWAGARINAPLAWWRARAPNALRYLANLWPWVGIVLVLWFPASWMLGPYFNQALLQLSMFFFFIFDLGLPLLIVFSGFAYDIQHD